jgi:hypothetical protein
VRNNPLVLLVIAFGGAYIIAKLINVKKNPELRQFSSKEAKIIGEAIGIDWSRREFSLDEFRRGLSVELEHGTVDPRTDITADDLLLTGKIAWAHLNELSDYYTRLERMEKE